MAQNVWNATLEPNNDVKQNSFDWTHVNNLTTQIGRITPIQCELVPAKTSFRVKPFPALQLMPMVFPIQTRMRATISYFRYPLRALWKDFKDFEGNFREGLEEPYHDFLNDSLLKRMIGTGKLLDYLGVPTTIVGTYGNDYRLESVGTLNTLAMKGNVLGGSAACTTMVPLTPTLFEDVANSSGNYRFVSTPTNLGKLIIPSAASSSSDDEITLSNGLYYNYMPASLTLEENDLFTIEFPIPVGLTASQFYSIVNTFSIYANNASGDSYYLISPIGYTSTNTSIIVSYNVPSEMFGRVSPDDGIDFHLFFNCFNSLCRYISGGSTRWEYVKGPSLDALYPSMPPSPLTFTGPELEVELDESIRLALTTLYINVQKNSGQVRDIDFSTSPYYSSNSANKDKQLKLSAYAARAYEGIYNSVYRDNRNNPYYIDGVVQYNQWIPSYDGGADSYPYELRYANWEKDFLTTAVQSPQQGNAPLVGITTYEQSSVVVNESGEPSTVKQTRVAMVDEEGKRYSLEFESDSDELKNVKYVELDNGTAVRSARSLFDLVTSGISITDLRNVNAYQKFLELNMRKGYSYKEIIEGRFDVKVRYADLLLPEFFGGFSRDINMNAITQTVDKDDASTGSYKDALGSQAGIGYFRGGTDANIECFCDEESIIMGLLVITPLPVYTQLLPKHFLYRGLLDHFNPEFNNISFQPITYKEVCPIQAYNENPDSLTATFGYQRPWYEYCQRYDQAHGLFRTDLSNFLMHRVFNQKPELAQSFLLIDPEQVTDVFSVTETTDKVYGQILLDCTVKLPVARVAIPRLD